MNRPTQFASLMVLVRGAPLQGVSVGLAVDGQLCIGYLPLPR